MYSEDPPGFHPPLQIIGSPNVGPDASVFSLHAAIDRGTEKIRLALSAPTSPASLETVGREAHAAVDEIVACFQLP